MASEIQSGSLRVNGVLVTVGGFSQTMYIYNNLVSESLSQLGYYLLKTYQRSAASSQGRSHKNE